VSHPLSTDMRKVKLTTIKYFLKLSPEEHKNTLK